MYFTKEKSISHVAQSEAEVVSKLIENFMAHHPPEDYDLRLQGKLEVDTSGLFHIDYNQIFQEVAVGTRAHSRAKLVIQGKDKTRFKVKCFGPTTIFINDEIVFKSTPEQENFRKFTVFDIPLAKKETIMTISSEKTTLGFGLILGNLMPQWEPTHFECLTKKGFVGFEHRLTSQQVWQIETNDFITSFSEGHYILRTFLSSQEKCEFVITNHSEETLYLAENRKLLAHQQISLPITGERELLLRYKGQKPFDMIEKITLNTSCELTQISGIADDSSKWQVISNLTEIEAKLIMTAKNLPTQIATTKAIWTNGKGEGVVRPFHTSSLHGFWTYPMGVTLYGMLIAGRFYQNDGWLTYTLSSLKQICDWDQFCLQDKKNFHYASINTQLYWLEELDDCGAFGAFMLEAQKDLGLVTIEKISDRIAQFMSDLQRRERDGAFSRADDTMWIDDLYMSVPFLVRRFETTANQTYLDDAVWQFLCYKKRFFDPEKQLMSHIFDPILEKENLIPWSRGNGWVLLALSELLQVLPERHQHYAELVDFFNEMLGGILKVQDETGLWHQVLDESTSYLESSSTAMFIVAMSRSVRQNYCDTRLKENVRASVSLAWSGLKNYCIDESGNLYGVCQGSGYSFSKKYYQSLGWVKNDPHGIGIVVLAGVEIEKLEVTSDI